MYYFLTLLICRFIGHRKNVNLVHLLLYKICHHPEAVLLELGLLTLWPGSLCTFRGTRYRSKQIQHGER